MRWLLRQAGEPQSHYPAVHIVGTHGKGSTISYYKYPNKKSGYQVGTFTSPYILASTNVLVLTAQIPDKDLISCRESPGYPQ